MLGRGWQQVEGTGNRARTGEYSTEEKWGVGRVMGSSQAVKSPESQDGAMWEGQSSCKEESMGNLPGT